ncbi:MAG: thioredoxin domain-containing protein, partial [Chloroflexota bacterium]
YEATAELRYLRIARELVDEMITRFSGESAGAFYDAPPNDDLVVRPRSLNDNPIPSGNAAACVALLRLHGLTGEARYTELALPILQASGDLLGRAPLAFAYLLAALDLYLSGPLQVALAGPQGMIRDEMEHAVFERYLPNRVLAAGEGDEPALLAGRSLVQNRTTAYVCRNFACHLPVTTVEELTDQLSE